MWVSSAPPFCTYLDQSKSHSDDSLSKTTENALCDTCFLFYITISESKHEPDECRDELENRRLQISVVTAHQLIKLSCIFYIKSAF